MNTKGLLKTERLLATLRQYPAAQRAALGPALQRRARAIISSTGGKYNTLVNVTPPYKADEKGRASTPTRQRGENAVRRDIRRVYGTPGALYKLIKEKDPARAAQFWKLVTSRQIPAANDVARFVTGQELLPFDGGTAHLGARNRRGRVREKQAILLYTADRRAVERYIARRQKNVGLLASTMVTAGEPRLGKVNGVPAWVRRHAGPWGDAQIRTLGSGERFTARISAPYSELDLSRLWSFYVLPAHLRIWLQNDIPRAIDSALKKARLA